MRRLVWRVAEWHMRRYLTAEELLPALGDLAEDLAKREAVVGTWRAHIWFITESLSVATAYRSRARQDQLPPRRTMTGLSMDEVRLAARRIRKGSAASIASVLTLACAIGAGAATWSLLSATLLHPLPVTSPDRLVAVGSESRSRNGETRRSQNHLYPLVSVVADSGAFDAVAAAGTWPVLATAPGSVPQQARVSFASANFFATLGVRPAIGRWFAAEEDRRGAPPVVVVSHRFWQVALQSAPDVLGRTITVAQSPATIVGVAPQRFRGLNLAEAPDVYLPLHVVADVASPTTNFFADETRQESPTSWITIVGRLRPGWTDVQTADRLNALAMDVRRGRTFTTTAINTAAIPEAARAGMAQFTRLLAATVGLLLLIGCLTVGMLLLIRAEARRDEFAMCLALGATRTRLARGIAIEGALLSIAGAAAALPIAWWLFSGLGAFQLPGGVAIDLLELSLDPSVVLAAAAAAVAATLLIALVAATFGFTANIADVLRSRAGATPRVTRRRTHAALVAAQIAVSVVLIAGAGLLGRSLVAALRLNPGLDTHRIVTGSLSLAPHGYSNGQAADFFERLRQTLEINPAIESVALIQSQGGMTPGGTIVVDGAPRQFPSMVAYTAVDERYFSTTGLRIVNGRDFSAHDATMSPPNIIVSESLGRLLAEDGNPIGHRITESHSAPGQKPAVVTIVGVVADLISNVNVVEPLVIYYPRPEGTSRSRTVVVRASGSPADAARETMAAIRGIDPAVTPGLLLTMEERLTRQLGPQHFGIVVLGVLGAIAALLTVLGTYVLATSMATVRTREIGIRAALGANRVQLGRMVLSQTLRLIATGLAAGLTLVWLSAGTIRAFLYRVEPLDVPTLAAVSLAMLVLTLAVSLRPAISAARVDLVRVLREE